MRQITYIFSVFTMCLVLIACGEISYKRGGTAQDIERAHQACRGTGEGFSKCLEKHGWESQNFNAFDPLFATVSISDNRQDGSKLTKYETQPLMVEIPVTEKNNQNAISNKTTKNHTVTSSQPSEHKPHHTPIKETQAQVQQKSSTINDGPDTTYVINSWWKMGAGADALKLDQISCEKNLGSAYAPDYKTRTFKRAFVACMHERDWKALREIK